MSAHSTPISAAPSCSSRHEHSCTPAVLTARRWPALRPGLLRCTSSGCLMRSSRPIRGTRLRPGSSGSSRRRCSSVRPRAAQGDGSSGEKGKEDTPFGYTRKDIILLGVGIIAFGYALYYGLQAAGVDALVAGNYVQLFVFLGIGVGYISTYISRVANKEMTYVKQLEDYEEAVMKKRLDEMPESEKERLLGEIEAEKARKEQQRAGKP